MIALRGVAAIGLAALAAFPTSDPTASTDPALRGFALRVDGQSSRVSWAASAAFAVDEGQAMDPCVPPGGERAEYRARVRIAKAGRFRFGAEVAGGRARVHAAAERAKACEVDGRTERATAFGEWLELARGEVELVVEFTREGQAAASLRTLWERAPAADGGAFGPEPISSFFARVDALSNEVASSEAAFAGRVLLERKGCVRCHAAEGNAALGPSFEAPRLDGLAARVDRGWLERWIADPAAMRAHTDMPALFAQQPAAAVEIARWLSASSATAESDGGVAASEPFVIERGRKLYHSLGCVACHGAFDAPSTLFGEEHADFDDLTPRERFGDMTGKWRPGALSEFLRDPSKTRPSGRMPSMKLSRDEADSLATYLISKWGAAPARESAEAPTPAPPAALSTCAACHGIPGVARATSLGKPLAQLDPARGCLDDQDRGTPRYRLDANEREQLQRALAEVRAAHGTPAPLDAARRRYELLDCGACHERDGRGGGDEGSRAFHVSLDEKADLGNEGRLPPELTGVGFKLEPRWLSVVLSKGERARPYLATRMPVFAAPVLSGLATGLARFEGLAPGRSTSEPAADDDRVQAGRALMGKAALACVTCHVYRDFAPLGTPGPRIDQFGERLRYEWWSAYMQDAGRYKPGTRMPSFESGGSSACRTILGGDLKQQFDALWVYASLGEFMPAPEGVERGRGLELVVGQRPIVMRTFLESIGPRAIAVGMPSGLHFCFDAQKVRLAEAWRGAFLDASGAWSGRGGENTGGEGPRVWSAPAGPPLAIVSSDSEPAEWPAESGEAGGFDFRGYELDPQGLPTFEYRWGECLVRETVRTEALPTPTLRRSFHIVPAPARFLVAGGTGRCRLDADANARVRELRGPSGDPCFEVQPLRPAEGVSLTLEIVP